MRHLSTAGITIFILLCHSAALFGQEQERHVLVDTDSTWIKETFRFPLEFAKDIPYVGFEDARFPKGWGKQDSSTFWSYAFAWGINLQGDITEKDLEENVQNYFDGLMQWHNTIALMHQTTGSRGISSYKGKIRTMDHFFTNKLMTLYVLADKYDCQEKQRSVILFRFSPMEFGHEVWHKLEEVKLRADYCNF